MTAQRTSLQENREVRLLDAALELMGRAGRTGVLEVCGESMRPSLAPGDRVVVAFEAERLRRGDLLLFRQEGTLVVHRLLGWRASGTGRTLRTRGDAAGRLDPPLTPDRVLGRVVAIRRGARWFGCEGPAARAYAWALGCHGLFWGVGASWVERRLPAVGRLVRRLDRALLEAVDRLFFRPCHQPRPSGEGC